MDLGWFETSLDVKDIVKSVDFYKTLGFQQLEGDVEVRCVTLNRGDCRLTLFQGHLNPPRTQLIFWQGDVDEIARNLMAKGLTFENGPNVGKEGASAMLFDPDGHPLFFINMPVHFVNDPRHARPAPPSRPHAANEDDMGLGWFEISLPVADAARSLAFYDKLGFRRLDKGGDLFNQWPFARDNPQLPKQPRAAVETLTHYFRYCANLGRIGRNRLNVGCVIQAAHLLAPALQGALSYDLSALALLPEAVGHDSNGVTCGRNLRERIEARGIGDRAQSLAIGRVDQTDFGPWDQRAGWVLYSAAE